MSEGIDPTESIAEFFADRVRRARKRKGLIQARLGTLTHTHRTRINRIERTTDGLGVATTVAGGVYALAPYRITHTASMAMSPTLKPGDPLVGTTCDLVNNTRLYSFPSASRYSARSTPAQPWLCVIRPASVGATVSGPVQSGLAFSATRV